MARFVSPRKIQRKQRKYCLDTVLHLIHCSFINSAEMKENKPCSEAWSWCTTDSSTDKVLLDSSGQSEILFTFAPS